jgi:hypothetical protein
MKQPIKDDEELETMMFCMINIHHLITNEKLRVLHLQKLMNILYAEYDKLGLHNPNIEQGENE